MLREVLLRQVMPSLRVQRGVPTMAASEVFGIQDHALRVAVPPIFLRELLSIFDPEQISTELSVFFVFFFWLERNDMCYLRQERSL